MGQETQTTETATSESTDSSVDILLSQGIEGPSEAELRGEETTNESKTSEKEAETETEETESKDEESKDEESKDEETTDEDKSKETDTKDEENTTEKDTASSEPKVKEHPKGYVPIAAVHEARGEIKYLKEQLQDVQKQFKNLQENRADTTDTELDEFETLTDEEFEVLAEDDPTQAAIYLRKLNAYEAKQREDAQLKQDQEAFIEAYEGIIENSMSAIEKVAPGIYDKESGVQAEIMEFANEFGFSEEMYYLTDPTTKVILPGETEPVLLGEQAADILGMLVNAKSKMVAPDTSNIETRLREEITAELVKKFKTPDTQEYRSLNQVPKTDDETPTEHAFHGKVLTTEQLLKLTDAEYEAYLAGN